VSTQETTRAQGAGTDRTLLPTIRVASVPAGHVYVRHLSNPEPAGARPDVVRLPDPSPGADIPDAQWWPPPMLEPRWVHEHADEFDVFHVHFGFDARTPKDLRALVQALRAHGKPLVYTAHDLRNPHHDERGLHDDTLDVLVPAADALVTITEGAAREIRTRWGRRAHVLPHPHVVEEPTLSRPRPRPRPEQDDFVVGVHIKSLRPSMDPLPVVEALAGVVAGLPGARLRVDAHTDVMSPGHLRYAPSVATGLRDAERRGRLQLSVHDYFSDAELWDYFQSIDLSVLPYRFGTHSGWLEACWDLGTKVLAPTVGYLTEQRTVLRYPVTPTGPDEQAIREGVLEAYADRSPWRARPAARMQERRLIAAAHRDLYEGVLNRVAPR